MSQLKIPACRRDFGVISTWRFLRKPSKTVSIPLEERPSLRILKAFALKKRCSNSRLFFFFYFFQSTFITGEDIVENGVKGNGIGVSLERSDKDSGRAFSIVDMAHFKADKIANFQV